MLTNARSILRRLLARYSGSFFERSASVGLPLPVHTKALEDQACYALWAALRVERGTQRTRRTAVEKEFFGAACLYDVVDCRFEIVGAVRDIAVNIAMLSMSGRSLPYRCTTYQIHAAQTNP